MQTLARVKNKTLITRNKDLKIMPIHLLPLRLNWTAHKKSDSLQQNLKHTSC